MDDATRLLDRLGLPAGALASVDDPGADGRLAPLEEIAPPEPPERDHWEPEDDPNGAFLARCEVSERDEGPLSGLEVGVKDNVAVAGVPMTCGSPVLEGFVPPHDAPAVERLLSAGATVVGKTNMDEFALGEDETTMRFKRARNPRDPGRQPGSSSAGSGVAVAEGSVEAALGTDTGGSVRFPAAWSGVVGVKPTRGLVPLEGVVQFARTLDTVGVLARSTRTAARVLEPMAGDPGGYAEAVDRADPGELTVGVPDGLFGRAPDPEDRVRAALDRLERAGATVRAVAIDDLEYALPAWSAIAATEFAAYLRARGANHWSLAGRDVALTDALARGLERRGDELGGVIVEALLRGERLVSERGNRYYPRAHRARERVAAGVDGALSSVDVLASVTVPSIAPAWGAEVEDLETAVANTAPFNLTGHPAISVPCGEVDGLPVGAQFVGPRDGEPSLFEAAAAVEAALE